MSLPESLARRLEEADGLDELTAFVRDNGQRFLVSNDAVDSLLGGDWLGHRLHPVAATIPMGAFTMATLLAVTGRKQYDDAVDALLLTGIVSALPTAVAGAHDLATTSDKESRVGLIHAASMDAALVLYSCSLLSRRRGHRRRGTFFAVAGAAVAGGGAYLGGHLVYRLGVGVDD